MTKIKKFRITCRPREVARWLKKERGMETTPDLELSIDRLVEEGKRWIEPAAVYTTLTRPIAEKTTALVFPEKAIAVSVLAVSIGPCLEKERLAAASDPLRESLLAALAQEAVSQALQFGVRLIQEQAKEEECELGAPVLAAQSQGVAGVATLVGVERIGIALAGSAGELPSHARVAWLFWTPAGKGSASARTTAGKTSSSAEKVAA